MQEQSKTGKTLDGRDMRPPGMTRVRPFGHVAVLVSTEKGYLIRYEPDAAQAKWDREHAR